MERTKTYVCKRARMCNYLMDCGFQPYRIAVDRDSPAHEVFLFYASADLYKAVMDYIKKRPAEDGKISVRMSPEDWQYVLDALNLAEGDRIEQARNTTGNEDKSDCLDTAAAYTSIFASIQQQIGGEKDG